MCKLLLCSVRQCEHLWCAVLAGGLQLHVAEPF